MVDSDGSEVRKLSTNDKTNEEITVKVLAMDKPGSPIEIRCRLDDRVAKLHALAAAQHVPPVAPGQHLKLLFCGRLLSDAKTLREESMEDGCTVHAILSKSTLFDANRGRSRPRPQRPRQEEEDAGEPGERRGLDALTDMGFNDDDAAQMWALYRMETGLSDSGPDAPRDYDREEEWLRIVAGQRPRRSANRRVRTSARVLSQQEAERAVEQLALFFAALQDEEVIERFMSLPQHLQQQQENRSWVSRLKTALEFIGGLVLGFILGVMSTFLLCEVRMSRRMQLGMLLGMAGNIILTYTIATRAMPQKNDKIKP